MWLLYAVTIAVIIFDRISKFLITSNITLFSSVPIIKNILNFTYVRNTGAAFSMFSNSNIILAIISVSVVCCGIVFIYWKKLSNPFMLAYAGMIIGGALGNVIDRFCYNYVIDFIDVRFMKFAVFNVADCFIVVGCILLAAWIMLSDSNKNDGVRLVDRD